MYKAILGVGSVVLGGSMMATVAYLQFVPIRHHLESYSPDESARITPAMVEGRGSMSLASKLRIPVEPSSHSTNRASLDRMLDSKALSAKASSEKESAELVVCSDYRDVGPTLIAQSKAGDTRQVRLLCPAGVSPGETFGQSRQ
jgi:hypothetical protein